MEFLNFCRQFRLWRMLSNIRSVLLGTFAPTYNTKRLYKAAFGKKLNLEHPHEFNEKIQWLKLNTYYHNDLITQCVDKYRVREYLEEKGMTALLPKLYGVYSKGEEIDWQILPNKFVLKCNHGCGYNILCSDKDKLDKKKTISLLNKWLKKDYWKIFSEIQYKDVKKKIIAEEHLGDGIDTYKFFCFNGIPKFLYVLTSEMDENSHHPDLAYYDIEWHRLPYKLKGHGQYPGEIKKPESLKKMIEISRKLSEDFPFVRVDLYDVQGKIFFSELTFIPTGGLMKIKPDELGVEMGSWLRLPSETE